MQDNAKIIEEPFPLVWRKPNNPPLNIKDNKLTHRKRIRQIPKSPRVTLQSTQTPLLRPLLHPSISRRPTSLLLLRPLLPLRRQRRTLQLLAIDDYLCVCYVESEIWRGGVAGQRPLSTLPAAVVTDIGYVGVVSCGDDGVDAHCFGTESAGEL